MCLYYDKNATMALRKKMDDHGGTMTFWKVYRRRRGKLLPRFVAEHGFVCHGDVVSDRCMIVPGEERSDVKCLSGVIGILRGIHVYTSRSVAVEDAVGGGVAVVPVTCRADDLVGAEGASCTAVFMRVGLSKSAYNRAIRPGS